MTDRELLELAAKAMQNSGNPNFANFKTMEDGKSVCLDIGHRRGAITSYWRPMYDDGDALRLAMKLRIWPNYDGCSESTPAHACAYYKSTKGFRAVTRWVIEHYVPEEMFVSSFLPDRSQAAYQLEQGLIRGFEVAQRRAIVRAAAELGKETK